MKARSFFNPDFYVRSMKYKLIRKRFGIKDIAELCVITLDSHIDDICFVKEHGIFVSSGQTISIIDINSFTVEKITDGNGKNKNCSSYLNNAYLEAPISFFYDDQSIYMIQAGGKCPSIIDVSTRYMEYLLGGNDQKKCNLLADTRYNKEKSFICCDDKMVYWTMPSANRIAYIHNNVFDIKAGSSKRGFSTSNNLQNCRLASPTGICCNKEMVYVCDSDNKCIRKIGRNIELLCGSPHTDDFYNPQKIILSDNIFFVHDKNQIKSFPNKATFVINTIYEGDATISMTTSRDKKIYILEEVDG